MTAPTLEPLDEEELGYLADGYGIAPEYMRDLMRRAGNEVRASRAAALSEADREALEYMRREFADRELRARAYAEATLADKQARCLALLDRLLGRNAT